MSDEKELKRVLCGRVAKGATKAGKPVADLFSVDTRLQFPVAQVFDLSMLAQIRVDPNELGTDPIYRRFWAHYFESSKTTKNGNPYLDVQYLELVEDGQEQAPAAVDLGPVLIELRAIRGLLQFLTGQVDNLAHVAASTADPFSVPDPEDAARWQREADRREAREAAAFTDAQITEEDDDLDAFLGSHAATEAATEACDPAPESRHEANSDAEVPTSPRALVDHLRGLGHQVAGAGELFHLLRKANPDTFTTWPTAKDVDGWRSVTTLAETLEV